MKVAVFDSVGGNIERYQPYCDQFSELEMIPFRGRHARDCMAEMKTLCCEAALYTAFELEPPEFFENLAEAGIRYISCVSAGHDHLNLPLMEQLGIRAGNVPRYSPNSVAEYAVMALLACARNLRAQVLDINANYFKINTSAGKELREMTIGVVGAGRIGSVTIECLSGFHPKKIYAYTRHPSNRWEPVAEYAPLEKIYAEADAIIYHTDLNDSTRHMLSREAISQMKDGVIVINPSRGGIADSEALLWGVENGKIGALGIDVIENEVELTRQIQGDPCCLPELRKLLEYRNVLFTPHTAYYTNRAEKDLAEITINNLVEYARTGRCRNELTGLD